MGGVSDDDDLLSVDDGHSSQSFFSSAKSVSGCNASIKINSKIVATQTEIGTFEGFATALRKQLGVS
jgi:hypothetical protein